MKTYVSLLWVIACLFASNVAAQDCKITFDGIVIGDSGEAVAEAKVIVLEPVKPNHIMKAIASYPTSSTGAFHFVRNLSGPGKVWVLASKEEDGYPDKLSAFYVEKDPETINVKCGEFVTGIVIHAGPKTGFIRKVTVVDEDGGRPVAKASITFRRVVPAIPRLSGVDIFRRDSSTDENIPIPSNVNISYEVSAPGYVTSRKDFINVKPMEKIDLSVQLQKEPPESQEKGPSKP